GLFVAAMAAIVVCGCIFTRKPRKKLPTETLRPAVPQEHSRAVSLSKKKGAVIGLAAAYRPLKKLGRRCDVLLMRDEARRISRSRRSCYVHRVAFYQWVLRGSFFTL